MDLTNLTLADLLGELQSYIRVNTHIISEAKKTGINYNNNPKFKNLANAWVKGDYDEDVDSLLSKLTYLIPFDDMN